MSSISARFGKCVLILAPNLDRMVPFDHGQMFLPIVRSIGASNDRVALDAAHHGIVCISEVPEIVKTGNHEVLFILRAGP